MGTRRWPPAVFAQICNSLSLHGVRASSCFVSLLCRLGVSLPLSLAIYLSHGCVRASVSISQTEVYQASLNEATYSTPLWECFSLLFSRMRLSVSSFYGCAFKRKDRRRVGQSFCPKTTRKSPSSVAPVFEDSLPSASFVVTFPPRESALGTSLFVLLCSQVGPRRRLMNRRVLVLRGVEAAKAYQEAEEEADLHPQAALGPGAEGFRPLLPYSEVDKQSLLIDALHKRGHTR